MPLCGGPDFRCEHGLVGESGGDDAGGGLDDGAHHRLGAALDETESFHRGVDDHRTVHQFQFEQAASQPDEVKVSHGRVPVGSFPCPVGRAFFDEGLHAFLLVLAVEEAGRTPACSPSIPSLSGVSSERLIIFRAARTASGAREAISAASDSASSRQRSGGTTRLTMPKARAWRAERSWLLRIISMASARPTAAGAMLGAASAGDDADGHLGQAEARRLGGNDHVAGQGKLAAAAQRPAGDSRDHGFVKAPNALEGGEGIVFHHPSRILARPFP